MTSIDGEYYGASTDPTYGDTFQDLIVNTKELSERTGATIRQIDYWCTRGYITPVREANPGSGQRRQFNAAIINKVKLMVNVSKALTPRDFLQYINDNYEEGFVDLGHGITLSWDVIEVERQTT